jgi:glycosyltransferase involved in cell wall biosynthesis
MKTVAYNAMALCEPASGVAVTIRGLIGALADSGAQRMQVYAPRSVAGRLPSGVRLQTRPSGWPWPSRALRILWEQALLPMRLRTDGAGLLHAPAYVAPLASPCPVVLTVHDLHVFTHPQFCTSANRAHYRLLMPPSIRRAAAIIVFSEHVRHTLAAWFPEASAKTVVIPPGIDPAMRPVTAPAECETVRRRYGLPDHYLLFVGDLAPRKNLLRLLEAYGAFARRQPEIHLLLVGRPVCGSDALDRAIAACTPVGRVHCTGYVPQAHLPALYSLADALVYPSYDEGFGLPALEAMACGCPVVTAGQGGPQEICGEAATYCKPEDAHTITHAIQLQYADPDGRRQRTAVGLRRAATFSWAQAASRTEALYGRLLG